MLRPGPVLLCDHRDTEFNCLLMFLVQKDSLLNPPGFESLAFDQCKIIDRYANYIGLSNYQLKYYHNH